MPPTIKHRDMDRPTTGERLKALREALDPEPSQGDVAARIGEGQMWLSRRERDKPGPTADEAILIAEALGYAAELLIVDRKHRKLLARLGELVPKDATLILRLLAAFPHFDDTAVHVLTGLIEVAERRVSKSATS